MQTMIVLEQQDLTYLEWTRSRNSSGTAGSFLKADKVISKKYIDKIWDMISLRWQYYEDFCSKR